MKGRKVLVLVKFGGNSMLRPVSNSYYVAADNQAAIYCVHARTINA
jgi:hypothetical protein